MYLEMPYEGSKVLVRADFTKPDNLNVRSRRDIHYPCEVIKVIEGELSQTEITEPIIWWSLSCYIEEINKVTQKYGWVISINEGEPPLSIKKHTWSPFWTDEGALEWVTSSAKYKNKEDNQLAKVAIEIIQHLNKTLREQE